MKVSKIMLAHLLYLSPSLANCDNHIPLTKTLSDASYSDDEASPTPTPKGLRILPETPENRLHPFLKAAKCGDIKSLRKYEREHDKENLREIKDELNGFSALHYAVASGSSECIQFLVALKFPVNLEARNGVLPFALTSKSSWAYEILADSGSY